MTGRSALALLVSAWLFPLPLAHRSFTLDVFSHFSFSFHFHYPHCSAMAFAMPGKVLLLAFAVRGSFQAKIFPFSSLT